MAARKKRIEKKRMPAKISPEEEQLLLHSPALRFARMEVQIDGRKIDFRRYPFLIDLYDLPRRKGEPLDLVAIKGAQMGFTSWQILWTIDGAINVYENQIGIYFPTEPDVQKFSKSRFARLMAQNPGLSRYVRETNSANMRQIGEVFVFFSGMKSRSAAKSTPNDLNVYDERDEMEADMVELADRRLDGSEFKHRVAISTPTIPDYGVDLEFKTSDQRHWMIRCNSCGKHTCLENEFPQCLQRRTDGKVERICIHCKAKIYPFDGTWQPLGDPKAKRMGFYVSQLNSPTVNPTEILDEYEHKQREGEDLTEFYNSRLGRAYANIDDCLEAPMIFALCKGYDRATRSIGPTFMGADVGKVTHWIVGEKRTDDHLRILNWGTVDVVDDLRRIIDLYGVQNYVIDQMAETHKVRSFCAANLGGYGCYYSQQIRNHTDWNDRENTVTVNRTETLDRSHAMITKGQVDFPRADTSMRTELAVQLCNLARTSTISATTGRPEARWIVRGSKRDHYRHAFNYACIAADRLSAYAAGRMRAVLQNHPSYRRSAGWMSA